eukprot:5436084-Amphidinium_carterae.2
MLIVSVWQEVAKPAARHRTLCRAPGVEQLLFAALGIWYPESTPTAAKPASRPHRGDRHNPKALTLSLHFEHLLFTQALQKHKSGCLALHWEEGFVGMLQCKPALLGYSRLLECFLGRITDSSF